MTNFKLSGLEIADCLDKDGELEVVIDATDDASIWLTRNQIECLRDHLNKVLGVAQ